MSTEWAATKPSRSDEVLDADQQDKMTEEVRTHFDSLAPKRPIKPNRSESPSLINAHDHPNYYSSSVENIPEQDKLQALRSQSHPIGYEERNNSSRPQEEFVETQYYTELNSIDKQHHTTGKGFISHVVEGGEDHGFAIRSLQDQDSANDGVVLGQMTPGFASNPATNEWIPSNIEEEANYMSSKPNRSESNG